MAEQTFRSPGFFEREIDLTQRAASPSGTPAGVVGSAERGPAFVPVTVGTFSDFQSRFGGFSADRFAPYAVNEWLRNRGALTFVRVLGAGANSTTADIGKTQQYGIVKNAGFVISGGVDDGKGSGVNSGFVQFLVADHTTSPSAINAYPIFDNRSTADWSDSVETRLNLVRGAIFFASGSRGYLTGTNESLSLAKINANTQPYSENASSFKIVISSSDGATFSTQDGIPGIRVFTCSLDPRSTNYYAKVLNTDPLKFQETQHLLYADFSVDTELASGSIGSAGNAYVGLATGRDDAGSALVSTLSRFGSGEGVKFRELFGRFDTRYQTARTTSFISQPFGDKEYDLFHFEAISDGAFSNSRYKVSIANLRASTDPNNPYGTFEVQVRSFGDTDVNPQILETFAEVNLNPQSDRYIARIMGDRKVRFDHDAEIAAERRLVVTGKYGNQSQFVRVVMNASLEAGDVPDKALPFGFRGIPTLKTSDSLTDLTDDLIIDTAGNTIGAASSRLALAGADVAITGSIVPPLPYRFKVTRGPLAATAAGDIGTIGTTTRVDRRFYWGVQNTRMPVGTALDPNLGAELNPLVDAYTKFVGIQKLDALVTGSGADAFSDNKFTLARVALSASNPNSLTDSADAYMLNAVYVRDAVPAGVNYVVQAGGGDRVTLATLVNSSSAVFNRFTPYNKFTSIFYGGFDGLNPMDKETVFMKDRSASTDTGGYAVDNSARLGLSTGDNGKQAGAGLDNNAIASYRTAIEIMTDPFAVRTNLLAIPGIRDPFVTDFAADQTRAYSLAAYLMDIPSFAVGGDSSSVRLYRDAEDAAGLRPDAAETAEQFDSRAIDNNYAATYFPDVTITDPSTGRAIEVPSSVAALGALGFNDRVSFPWFAPAGFNRGALGFVRNTATRLLQEDRDTLYDARINPIANFPVQSSSQQQYVIFGQKTMQQAQSALDRLNVRRLMLEVKRLVSDIARNLLFEANDAATRSRFVNQITPLLATIAAQQGIEQFDVVCDSSNNSTLDVEQNRMNGRIVLVPTRAIEFVAVDFIITNAGVSFE
jgi:hypothetical protein